MPMDKAFWNIRELSNYLNIRESTLYAKVGSGILPHYRIGRLIRFKKEEIDLWVEKNKKDISSEGLRTRVFFTKPGGLPRGLDPIVRHAIDEVKGIGV